MSCTERIFKINDLELHALHWLPKHKNDSPAILCAHGWLDNAGSFIPLAKELCSRGYELLAFDMAGCGRSSYRALHGAYNLWDDVIDIEALLEALGWGKYILMGHSRGAMIASLYAATQPKGINKLVLLDGILPPIIETEPLAMQLSEFLSTRKKLIEKNAYVETLKEKATNDDAKTLSMHEAWQQRQNNFPMSFEEMQPILERGLVKVGDGYLWSHDQRVKGRSVYRMSEADQKHLMSSLNLPGLLLLAKESRMNKAEYIDSFRQSLPSFSIQLLDGEHHFHLQDKHFLSVANAVDKFLETT